jgi:hypothetical protein
VRPLAQHDCGALGALGTTILFHWSFAFESFPYMKSRTPQGQEMLEAQCKRNRRRQTMQRVSLAFIIRELRRRRLRSAFPVAASALKAAHDPHRHHRAVSRA